MENAFLKAARVYFSTLNLTVYFSIFILLALVLLPLISSYVNVGGGFLRFSSFYLDFNMTQFLLFAFVGAVSLLLLSFFLAAIISIVKLKETLDHVKFTKAVATFPKYIKRLFCYLLLFSLASLAVGVSFDYLGLPAFAAQLIILLIWLIPAFTPQVIVLEDYGVIEALSDAVSFVKKQPMALVTYFVLGTVLLFAMVLVETSLGHYFIWEHKIVSIFVVSLFILPYTQMYASELYVRRYAVSRV
ncbi:MAG: hypothetical protein V1911_00250 [Candidatus Micrarchaeota archaeon]